jgi:hypothetical protein
MPFFETTPAVVLAILDTVGKEGDATKLRDGLNVQHGTITILDIGEDAPRHRPSDREYPSQCGAYDLWPSGRIVSTRPVALGRLD